MIVVRHTALNAMATLVATGGRLAITTLMARRLGPEAFGLLIFTQWCAETIAMVATFGLPSVLVRYCPELADAPTAASAARVRQLAVATAGASVAAIAIAVPIFVWLENSRGLIGILLPVSWSLAALALMLTNALATGLLRFEAVVASNLVFVAVGLTAVLLLAGPGDAATGMVVWILASLAASAVTIVTLWSSRGKASARRAGEVSPSGEVRRYAVNTWVGGLAASQLWTRGEMGVLRVFVPTSGIAHYGVATNLAGLIMQGVSLFQGGLTPHLARAWARKDAETIESLIRGLSGVTFAASIGGALLVVLFAHEIIALLFGPRFEGAAPALLIISFGATAAGAGTVNMVIQFATDGRFQRNANLIGATALVALAAALAPIFGIVGAAVARTLVVGGTGMVLMWMLARIGYRRLSRALAWRWLAGVAVLAAAAAAERLFHPNLPVRGLLFCLGGFGIVALFAERRWLTVVAALPQQALRRWSLGARSAAAAARTLEDA